MREFWQLVLECAWLLLPGYVANMAPIWFQRVPFLNIAVDLGTTFRGQPLFGAHKTYRGFFFGVLCAVLCVFIQQILFNDIEWAREISLVNYSKTPSVLLGVLLGFGALAGDLVKSFFKRRMNVPSGRSWFPFDQLDYVVGMMVFLIPLYRPDFTHIAVMIASSLVFHLIASYIGFLFGMKKEKI